MKLRRTLGWTLAGIAALVVLVVAAGLIYLRTNSFRQFAIREIVEQADLATGGKTAIGSFDFALSNLTAHLYNITIRGTESTVQPPLLHADKLTVSFKIISVIHHQISLSGLLVEHPAVFVKVSSNGESNVPTPPPSKSSSHTSVFDLAVRHAQLTNGEVNYNDRKIPLDADLHNLSANIRFESLDKRYVGTLSYDDGHLQYARNAPLSHDLNLQFSATPQQFDLKEMRMMVGTSELTLQAHASNYSQPVAEGEYKIRIHTQDFAAMSPSASPAGDVLLAGRLAYRSNQDQPLIRNVAIDGQVASDLLTAVASGRKVELRRLQGTYRLGNGNLNLTGFSVDTLGGWITANAEMKHLDGTPDSRVNASLSNISLKALQREAGTNGMERASIAGTLHGEVDAAWKGSVSNVRAHSDLFVQALARNPSNRSAKEVPAHGALHMDYDGPRQSVQVHDTAFQIPTATATAEGSISRHSNLVIHVVANDLHQLAALASSFGSGESKPLALSGAANLTATVQGTMQKPTVNAQLEATNLNVEGSEWKSAKLALSANSGEVKVNSASLINAHQGQATLTATVGLKNWSYEESGPIQAHLQVQQLELADLQNVASQHYPVSGRLSTTIDFHGSQLEPVGSGTLQVANANAYGEPIQNLAVKFNAENGSIVSNLNISTHAGAVNADVSFTPKTKAYKVRLDAPAVVVQNFQTVQEKNLAVTGTISASVNGEGTLNDPQLVATIQFPQLQIRKDTISGFKAQLQVAQHRANLALDSKVAQASIRARGTVALADDYNADATIDTGSISLAPLIATYTSSPPDGFQGQTELHASVKGPLKDKSRLEARFSIPVLEAKYQQLEIGIARPIRVDYAKSMVTLQPAELKGTGTNLTAQGRIPLGGGGTPTLTAEGSVDARILHMLAPDVQSSGVVALNVRSSGTAIQGQVKLQNLALTTTDAPIGVEKLNGTLEIGGDRVQIKDVTAQVGGGPISAGGSITYKPDLHFNLALQGKSMRLRYPEGLRSLLDANLTLNGTTQASVLNGRVLIDNLSFTPDFDLSRFGDQFSTGNTPSQPGFADTVKLAISVQSQQSLQAVSSQVSIAGQAVLQVGGTAGNPVITGRTTLTSGELFYRNLRYELKRGVITFDNPNETHPVLNVSVATVVEQYNLTLTLRGPLDKLTTAYVSDPPLATADIINLIARGKTTEEQAASSQSTDSMIASQVAGQLSSGIQKLAGISSLQIDPTLGGSNSNPSARVAIQQRVTKNLLFSFSTDVSQPGNEIVQGEYKINKRWSVSTTRDQLGGISIDGRYHTRF
ncbi:MAG TPA: translocation/assembly module TamB domain-containing protein [Candidatus Sulfotelmatobacter sp.]|nr:translocation/assembly module TamB domain-containing protein [Candidatus Sulfotelmatobacter sp.]